MKRESSVWYLNATIQTLTYYYYSMGSSSNKVEVRRRATLAECCGSRQVDTLDEFAVNNFGITTLLTTEKYTFPESPDYWVDHIQWNDKWLYVKHRKPRSSFASEGMTVVPDYTYPYPPFEKDISSVYFQKMQYVNTEEELKKALGDNLNLFIITPDQDYGWRAWLNKHNLKDYIRHSSKTYAQNENYLDYSPALKLHCLVSPNSPHTFNVH